MNIDIIREVIRVGLSLSYLLTAFFIIKDLPKWEPMIKPWISKILPTSKRTDLIITAIFDFVLGVWILTPFLTWLAAIIAGLHILQVWITVGFNYITYRDIAILTLSILLFLTTF